jgi:hypothetical protein
LISTAVLAFIYQRFGSKDLIQQIDKMRHSLIIAQRGLELGLRDMWYERRNIPSEMWNDFTKSARTQVWLLGVAEIGFAEDPAFERIVSDGTRQGCNYRFLILDPVSAAAKELDLKEGGGNQVQGRIRRALSRYQLMEKQNTGRQGSIEIRLYTDMPRVSIVRSDDELLVTPYMPPLRGEDCFSFHVQSTSKGIFEQYIRHFDAVWGNAKSLSTKMERG